MTVAELLGPPLAWTMYVAENHGQVLDYIWHNPASPQLAYAAYWPGALELEGVKGDALLCPAATEPTGVATGRGYGDATHSWTGQYASNGSAIRLDALHYRDGSYGYNRYLTAGGGFAGTSSSFAALQENSTTPLFMDCLYVDTFPGNARADTPPDSPPDLTGANVNPGSPEHWKFLIARHGRGINVCMADGSVAWVPLKETYALSWRNGWTKYHLPLPGT